MDLSGPWMNDAALDNRYKYNGKEYNDDFGLNWMDYGARWYDGVVGRFPVVDPIIEKFPYLTPYNYASNDSVGKIDLWGLQGVSADIIQRQYQEGALNHGVLANKVKKEDLMPLYKAQATGAMVGSMIGVAATAAMEMGAAGVAKEGIDLLWEQITGIPAPVTSLVDIGEAGAKVVMKEGLKEGVEKIGKEVVKESTDAANGVDKVKYIGRLEDLKGIPQSQTLLDDLPNLGNPKANYYQNMSVLRKSLRDGYTIKDASWFRPNSELAPTLLNPNRTVGQTFLGAERLLLKNRGLWP
jgi:RHS repeat-associated protein